MVNIASTILAGFQDDLVVLFGETLGWIVGHFILAAALATIVLGIKERDHIIQRSGFGKNEILDLGVFLLLTLSLFYIYTNTFNFESIPSLALGATSSLSIRWMVTVLG